MKYSLSKALGAALVLALGSSVLLGCSEIPPAPENTAAVEERCMVTGSNMPSKKCRNDATMLSPRALESSVPGGQRSGSGPQ